jgi:hypothetical protein
MARKPKSRKEMIAYLSSHQRYDTMSSWNNGTSFSRNIKINRIQFPHSDIRNRAYDMLDVEEAFDDFNEVLSDFNRRHNYSYQIGTNGRSGGYLVLYSGGKKETGFKSYCPSCGQRNYKLVPPWGDEGPNTPQEKVLAYYVKCPHWAPDTYPTQTAIKEIGLPDAEVVSIITEAKRKGLSGEFSATDKCGVCKHPRCNYTSPSMTTYTTGATIGEPSGDYSDWETCSLKDLVDTVWDFDKTAETALQAFISFCQDNEAAEETILVPKKIKIARPV